MTLMSNGLCDAVRLILHLRHDTALCDAGSLERALDKLREGIENGIHGFARAKPHDRRRDLLHKRGAKERCKDPLCNRTAQKPRRNHRDERAAEIKACSEKSLFCTDDGRDDDERHNGNVKYPSQ